MSLLVVGSVAFDSVKTPFGEAEEVLGGSATYFSVAASFFTPVSLVAVVGEDFPDKDVQFLKSRKIDTSGLERAKGRTFRWKGEYRQLSGETNLVKAAQKIRAMGPKILIIKRGEYGALFFSKKSIFHAPAYPLENVFDPTGAGDSFAGGFMGWLAKTRKFDDANIRRAIIMGSVVASFNVEDFSLNRFKRLKYPEITARYKAFKRLTHFENL